MYVCMCMYVCVCVCVSVLTHPCVLLKLKMAGFMNACRANAGIWTALQMDYRTNLTVVCTCEYDMHVYE